jgi:hypothetical protein
MASLSQLERLLERIFERSVARLFRTRIQVVQLEHRLERTMEQARASEGRRVVVPARFRVRMHPSDLAETAARAGGAQALAGRLADVALGFARAHDYHVPERPTVTLLADATVPAGTVDIRAVRGEPASAGAPARSPGIDAPGNGEAAARNAGTPAPTRHEDAGTRVFRRPAPPATRARLRVTSPDGRERVVEVNGAPLTIGRARDNTLVLGDGRVSRHHGRLQARHGALVYTDLDSTNGSRVNGIRVDEIVLGQGDRLEVGDTVLVVEALPG